MFISHTFLAAVLLAAPGDSDQAEKAAAPEFPDLSAIPRTIARPPKYETGNPSFCLLVFGQKAETRVWLVRDGGRMFIDKNANGDLTEPGEAHDNAGGSSFRWDEITEKDGTRHTRLYVFHSTDSNRARINLYVRDKYRQYAGYGVSRMRFSDKPEDAPIIHFNGPLTFARYSDKVTLPREIEGISYRSASLRVYLGSPGLGEDTFAGYRCNILTDCGKNGVPAIVEYAGRGPDGGQFVEKQFLEAKS